MKKQLYVCFACAGLALVLFLPSTAFCDEAYSNLGPKDSFDLGQGYAIGAFQEFPNIHIGFQFTAEATGVIESVDAAFSSLESNGSDRVIFDIWSSATDVPDSQIWSGGVQIDDFAPAIYNASVKDFSGGATLIAGEDYWLSARSASGTNGYIWFFNSESDFLPAAFDLAGGTDWLAAGPLEAGAFRVNVSAVPEPASGVLGCLLALAATRRGRRT